MKHVAYIAVATLIATSSPAFANHHKDGGADFAQIDANTDGQITQAELDAFAAGRFDAMDTNGDGSIDAGELIAARAAQNKVRAKARAEKMIERADENGNGALEQEEMKQRDSNKMIERLDKDGDGSISEQEFENKKHRKGKRKKRR